MRNFAAMMNKAWIVAALLIASFLVVKSEVLVLDESNFHDTIAKHDFVVVEFYAPWCGHCKQLAPEYEKASAALKDHEPQIVLANVNADDEKNKKLASDFGVRGFPTLKIIRNKGAIVEEYKGPRKADGIVSYLKKHAGPATEELTSAEDAGDFVGQNKVAIIGVFKSYDSDEFATYSKLADALRSEVNFRHTLDASLLPLKDEPLTAPAVRLFKTFDERFNDFNEFDLEKMKEWIEAKSTPMVVELSQDPEMESILSKFFNKPSTKAYFFASFDKGNADDYRAALKEAAHVGKPKGIDFMIINAAENDQALQHFGLEESKVPTIIIQESSGKKFVSESIDTSKLTTFVGEYLDGKLKEWIKSAPIPETNDEPVLVVVRDSLQELVLDSGKDVLLEFYAPWCGHCKKLAPTLDKVANHFKDDASVVIAKFDATTNDVPEELFDVKGFPTLYLYTSQKTVVPYDGDRSEADLIKFMEGQKSKTEEPVSASPVAAEDAKDEL